MGVPQGDYLIETIPVPEVETVIDWAAGEGWNPGLGDAACFYAIDPNGFFMGVLVSLPIYDEHLPSAAFILSIPLTEAEALDSHSPK